MATLRKWSRERFRAFRFPPHLGATIQRGAKEYTLINTFLLEQIAAVQSAEYL